MWAKNYLRAGAIMLKYIFNIILTLEWEHG